MRVPLGILFSTLLLASCATAPGKPSVTAMTELNPTQGNSVSGTVKFSAAGDRVRVEAEINGLKPGQHGFHIHDKGDCSAPDGTSAGGHFNPKGKPHNSHVGSERHGGDLGNLMADSNGKATLSLEVSDVSIGTGADGIVGRSVIVHADPDDYKTQPSGNSGKRIACGVIVLK